MSGRTGAWDSGITYRAGAFVFYNEEYYTCKVSTRGSTPGDGPAWTKLQRDDGSPDTAFYVEEVNGRVFLGAPDNATVDRHLGKSRFSVWVDQETNTLVFRVRYSTGALKTGIVALV